jgi:hypothetical protein
MVKYGKECEELMKIMLDPEVSQEMFASLVPILHAVVKLAPHQCILVSQNIRKGIHLLVRQLNKD